MLPRDFPRVLADELKDIRARRAALFPEQAPLPANLQLSVTPTCTEHVPIPIVICL